MSHRELTPVVVFKLKMSEPVAAYMKGKDVVALHIPLIFAAGQKLLMVEWNGGPTGRADLCTIIGYGGQNTILERRFCWGQGKLDDDLSQFGLTLEPGEFSMVTKLSIPENKIV